MTSPIMLNKCRLATAGNKSREMRSWTTSPFLSRLASFPLSTALLHCFCLCLQTRQLGATWCLSNIGWTLWSFRDSSLEHLVTWRNSDAAPLGSAEEWCLFIVTAVELQPFKMEGQEPLAKSLWCSTPNLSWWTCHSVLGSQFEGLLIHLEFGKPRWVIGQNAACSCLGSGKVHGNKETFSFSFWA